jgi:hypothetical protein
MLILGKNSDDKGTQLENLTQVLLLSFGFTNIVTNDIRAGGAEIDIRAERQFLDLVDSQNYRVICECKAYREPANINDWLKFLGKIFLEEKRLRKTVYGYFIALNGVNGNVAGQYDELQLYANNIKLVTGEDLRKLVREKYNLCDLETVNRTLKRFTERQVQSLEIAYYKNQVFWIVTFEEDAFTILRFNSDPIDQNSIKLEGLEAATGYVLPAMSFIDLQYEAEALRRSIIAKKYIISILINGKGKVSVNEFYQEKQDFTKEEIDKAADSLLKKSWLTKNEGQEYCLLDETTDNFYSVLIEVYRFLLRGEFINEMLNAFGSDSHKCQINECMLKEIQKNQGDLVLSVKDIEQVLLLLKLSPSALAWALHPNETLINQREDRDLLINIREQVDLMNRNYFISELYSYFKKDFDNPYFHSQFYQVHGIREIEAVESLIVKSATGVELQGESRLRLGILPLADGFVSPYGIPWITVAILDHTPQPWENSAGTENSDDVGDTKAD